MTKTTQREVTVRARAFSGAGVEKIRAIVDADGAVRVYDDVAQHYTACHILGKSAQQRIRRLAAERSALRV
ncbi:MAG: hypothetical protein KJ023_00180 [Burkholderiaceae bacterium]|nr:hypothetical protein [Burkholderiaceae bacterium]